MTLISLISRQIWPQVLLAAQLKPSKIILVHTSDKAESLGPAERLERFFQKHAGFFSNPSITKLLVPHDNFEMIGSRLDGVLDDPSQTMFNITGGNKLMSTATFEKARIARRPVVYLERGNTLVEFFYKDEARDVRQSKLDPSICNDLDAADLCECQSGEAVLSGRGERLTLNEDGRAMSLEAFMEIVKKAESFREARCDPRDWLDIEVLKPRDANTGDPAEYATAFVVLKLGISSVYRSLEFTPSAERNADQLEGELDLVFNHNGTLWIVDCKDKASSVSKLDRTERAICRQGIPIEKARQILHELAVELQFTDKKILREDLQQVLDVGGVQGRVIAVRSSGVEEHVRAYVKSRRARIDLIHKNELHARLKALLYPNQPA